MNEIAIRAVWDIDHDGTHIAPGETAVLPEETARALIEGGAAETPETPEAPVDSAELAEAPLDADPEDTATGDDRRLAILAAIAGLVPGNPDHWTKSGKPEVRALEAATGFGDISAAERDAVWTDHQAARG